MKLQIFSDLHLEFGEIPVPRTDADVVIAAGDIHVQAQGIDWLKSFEQPVIYICGNHEYWNGEYQETIHLQREACAGSNISFLEKDSVEVGNTIFHGCTLWTDYAAGNQLLMEESESRINDFKYIRSGQLSLRAQRLYEENQLSLAWLKQQLLDHGDKQQVVVTHHAPSTQSWARSHADMLQFAYCNRFDDWLKGCGADLWVHGHIHSPADYKLGDTRVVCNPRGYHGVAEREDFDPMYCVEI